MLKNENKTVSFWLSCFACSPLLTFSLAPCAHKASLRHSKQKPMTIAEAQHRPTLQPLAAFLMVDGWEGWVLWCHDMKGMQQFQAEKEGHICILVSSFQRINSVSDGTQKSRDNVYKSKQFMVSAKPVSSSLSWKPWTREGYMHHIKEASSRWTCHLAL